MVCQIIPTRPDKADAPLVMVSIETKICESGPTTQFGICSTDLQLDTSTNGLKQVYTSPQAIY
jgi:hypothetical protein